MQSFFVILTIDDRHQCLIVQNLILDGRDYQEGNNS